MSLRALSDFIPIAMILASIAKQLHRPKSQPKCNPPVRQPGLTRRISLSNPIVPPRRSSLAASKKKRRTICGILRAGSEGCQDQPGTRYDVATILNQTLTLARPHIGHVGPCYRMAGRSQDHKSHDRFWMAFVDCPTECSLPSRRTSLAVGVVLGQASLASLSDPSQLGSRPCCLWASYVMISRSLDSVMLPTRFSARS